MPTQFTITGINIRWPRRNKAFFKKNFQKGMRSFGTLGRKRDDMLVEAG